MKGFIDKYKFPGIIVLFVMLALFIYQFSYLLPLTNNAFVVANISPVAANVSGYVTGVYVHNEQNVVKGQPLFQVFPKPYEYAYLKAKHDVDEAKAVLSVLKKKIEKTQLLIQAQKQHYEKRLFDYQHNKSASYDHAVSQIKVHTTLKEKDASFKNLQALEKELEINKLQISVQESKIKALIAVMNNAKVSLDETTVYALYDGSIQNMFIALGGPVKERTPLFTLVDTSQLFIQANFYETDLRHVRPGNKVLIFPRIYLGSKVYHGRVVSQNWAANRLAQNMETGLQIIRSNERDWFLLPQRLPVQILITDYDPKNNPLSIGQSAYVYIVT
ncbi:MAG: multidrug transporter [Legionella sp.]|nr:MAG: multidrug transporter [Legionella sp.]PJE00170.1 MAG: multidrug transporter [Legionella sp.]